MGELVLSLMLGDKPFVCAKHYTLQDYQKPKKRSRSRHSSHGRHEDGDCRMRDADDRYHGSAPKKILPACQTLVRNPSDNALLPVLYGKIRI